LVKRYSEKKIQKKGVGWGWKFGEEIESVVKRRDEMRKSGI